MNRDRIVHEIIPLGVLLVPMLLVGSFAIRMLVGRWIGYGFFVFLGPTGLLETRIGRELAYVVVNLFGAMGLNTSGRPGDDPFLGLEDFPWALLSIGIASVVANRFVSRRASKEKVMRDL
jgi:hypothetical protein